jgi:hypothetical protein
MTTQFFTLLADSILERAQSLKNSGARFAQMSAAPRNGGGIDLLYSFDTGSALVHFCVPLDEEDKSVQSITGFFLAAFLSENEISELWGVKFAGLALDYHGKLYDPKSPAPFRISPGYPAVPGMIAPGTAAPAKETNNG